LVGELEEPEGLEKSGGLERPEELGWAEE
jgi:hypothetical protein